MTVVYHPDFPKDIRRYRERYYEVSSRLGARFEGEVDTAIERIKDAPASAGHFLNLKSEIIREYRRTNLSCFPFFILYGVRTDQIVIGSLIPTASDPLTWLARFRR